MGYRDATFDPSGAGRASGYRDAAASARLRRRDYGRAAFATAVDDGLMPDEVRDILAGRRIVDAFPVRRGESPPAYAGRAVAEMMVAYLAREAT